MTLVFKWHHYRYWSIDVCNEYHRKSGWHCLTLIESHICKIMNNTLLISIWIVLNSRVHEKRHRENTKTEKCTLCSAAFEHKFHLKQHMKRKHGAEVPDGSRNTDRMDE